MLLVSNSIYKFGFLCQIDMQERAKRSQTVLSIYDSRSGRVRMTLQTHYDPFLLFKTVNVSIADRSQAQTELAHVS